MMHQARPYSFVRSPFGAVLALLMIVALLTGQCPSAWASNVPVTTIAFDATDDDDDKDHHHEHCQTLPAASISQMLSPAGHEPEPFMPAIAAYLLHFDPLKSNLLVGALAFDPSEAEPRSRFLTRLQRFLI